MTAPLGAKQTCSYGNHPDVQFSRKTSSDFNNGRNLGKKKEPGKNIYAQSILPPAFSFSYTGVILAVASPRVHYFVQPCKLLRTNDAG